MANPNNCQTCEYSQLNGNREKGHCYMFRDEPTEVCMQHTGRQIKVAPLVKWARGWMGDRSGGPWGPTD